MPYVLESRASTKERWRREPGSPVSTFEAADELLRHRRFRSDGRTMYQLRKIEDRKVVFHAS